MKYLKLTLIFCLCLAAKVYANDSTTVLLHKGDSCMNQYDTFHATEYYQKYLEENPSHFEVRRKLASCYRKVGNYTACISCLDMIPTDSISHDDMHMYYYSFLNQDNAEKIAYWGERITTTFPYDSEIVASFASYCNGANQPGKAEDVTRKYIKSDSTNLYVNKEYAYSLFLQFKYDEAIPLYEKLIAQGFDNFVSNFVLGLCYENVPDYDKAQECYQNAARFKSDNATCLFHLGLAEKTLYMDSLSLVHLNKSLEASLPKGRALRTYKLLADIYFQHKRYAEAGRAFELCAIYDEEDDPLNYYNAAQMFIASKNQLKAKLYLQLFLANSSRLKDKEEAVRLTAKAKEQLKQ